MVISSLSLLKLSLAGLGVFLLLFLLGRFFGFRYCRDHIRTRLNKQKHLDENAAEIYSNVIRYQNRK